MTVAVNMAAVGRLKNPFRLSSFGDQGVLRHSKAAPHEGENQRKDNDRCREEYNEYSC